MLMHPSQPQLFRRLGWGSASPPCCGGRVRHPPPAHASGCGAQGSVEEKVQQVNLNLKDNVTDRCAWESASQLLPHGSAATNLRNEHADGWRFEKPVP
eukprot:1159942-Pelagomonas_calceolata.AAC.2